MASERHSRQTFLGEGSEDALANAAVGIVGLGGGGTHIAQQMAHIGIARFANFDPQTIEASNLNRMVGATEQDVVEEKPKVLIAERLIKGINPRAHVTSHQGRWQDHPEDLRSTDIIFGCVDTFSERRELEVCARRYLIPYIDIGMDVHARIDGEPPRMVGQVILSLPGGPCLNCYGLLSEENLAREASLYGAVGSKPQVVWPNAVLASTAIGIAMDLITGWNGASGRRTGYFSYDGNSNTVQPHPRLDYVANDSCTHFPPYAVGDPVYKRL